MTLLTKAKYYALGPYCTPDISHKEQMAVILLLVQCDEVDGVTVKEAFLGHLRVDDSTGKGLLDKFMKRADELGLNLLTAEGNVMIMVPIQKAKKQASKPDFWKLIQKL